MDLNPAPHPQSRWKLWLFFLILAILLHFPLLFISVSRGPNLRPSPIDIQHVDPAKLDAIRKQWKEKSLLINKDLSKPKDAQPPPDARFMSDRNIRVEKEQRAMETDAVLKQNEPSGPGKAKSAPNYPKLGSLGIPLNLSSEPSFAREENSSQQEYPENPREQHPKEQQWIPDKNLTTGSENLLNAQESIYYSFYSRLYESIGPIWQSRVRQTLPRNRVLAGSYVTTVDIILDETGSLIEVRRLQSSGIPEFDSIVEESWRKIQRFPNPPRALLDPQHQVHSVWTFRIDVNEGSQLSLPPPERTF